MVERNQGGSVRWTFSFVTYQRYDVIFSEKQNLQLKQECMWVLSHVQLCDLMDYDQPGSLCHGIFQARILKWVAISFSIKQEKQ